MRALAYQEDVKAWFRPRHPVVAMHDSVVAIGALCLALTAETWLQYYLCIVGLMFGVSALHHWLPYAAWHHRLDRSMIQIMIAGTPLPYVPEIVTAGTVWWLVALWIWALGFLALKLLAGQLMYRGLWPAVVYAVTGLLAVGVMWPVRVDEAGWATLFWLGVVLYALQLVSYNRKWFDVVPRHFGYREVQHLILLGAVSLHVYAANL